VLLALVLGIPGARALFEFSRLHAGDIAVCIALAMLSVTWFELSKLRTRTKAA
jgi:hypothetical protein